MSTDLPPLLEMNDYAGVDDVERWQNYEEGLYKIYLATVAYGRLQFRTLPVKCQFRPETFGRHFAFWHMMQEGKIEDKRKVDLDRCRRIAWIGWVICNADSDIRLRVFPQKRNGEQSWVLWLFEHNYAVILWKRNDYYLLKTAFIVKSHKQMEFQRDWENAGCRNG